MRLVRFIEILIGIVFVAAAALKAIDLHAFAVQIQYYGVISDPSLVRYAALTSVGVETIFGVLLLVGIRARGLAYVANLLLLLVFTGLVGYAWAYHGLKDCGCFGKLIPLGPLETTLKNVALMALLFWAWRRAKRFDYGVNAPVSNTAEMVRSMSALGALAVVAFCIVYADNSPFFHPPKVDKEHPFAQFQVETPEGEVLDLGKGEYFVAMMSTTCDDCVAAVDPLNEIYVSQSTPPLLALMLGSEETLKEFDALTTPTFPRRLIDDIQFLSLIGKEPPRFYIIQDGKPLRHLDTLEATTEMLNDFAMGILEDSPDDP